VNAIKGHAEVGRCLPIHKCELVRRASDHAVKTGKAVTVLTYLHGLKEVENVLGQIHATQGEDGALEGLDVDLIELRSLKPLDMEVRHPLMRHESIALRAPCLLTPHLPLK
jgi:pyruvate/2-oxoglutarate/acetoin dehydrogenase E1 component